MIAVWTRAPLVPVAVAFGAGIALAPWCRPGPAWALWIVVVAATAALLALGRIACATVGLLIATAVLATLHAMPAPLRSDAVGALSLPASLEVEGVLAAEPLRLGPDRVRLLVDVERAGNERRHGRVQITTYGPGPTFGQGQRLAGEVRLHHPIGFRNPAGFDYAAWLVREGVQATGNARGDALRALDDPPPPWHVRVKRAAHATIERALPPVSAALLEGLLLGTRTNLPAEIQDGFRRAGVYHVLAVSGFNVALLAGAVFGLASLTRVPRRVGAVAAMIVVVGFAFVVGPEPSVLRAVIMAVLLLGALLLERDAAIVNSLALAALAILALRPGDLLDPGFQLSFAATAGIVAAPIPRGAIMGALGVSLAAQLAVLPITAAHFNQVNTIGVLANLGVVPLAGLATIGGLLALVLGAVTDVGATILFDAVWPLLLAMRALVTLAAIVPGALVHVPAPSSLAIVCYATALLLLLGAWHRRPAPRLAAGAVLLLGTALALGAWPLLRPPDGWLRVAVLDVGQGDAIVVEFPDRRVVLVDAGAGGPMRLDAGERVVAPFLWNTGALRLAAVMVTHSHLDHAGGFAAVERHFPIAERWGPGIVRSMGGVEITSFAPPAPPTTSRGARPNETAILLRLEYGLASFLLASDVERTGERALVAGHAPLSATVLKVPHHGAAGASTDEFLRAIRPALAVVSVGARNPYGHPDAATLERLTATGARVYRTDRDGAVLFETDGHRLAVTAWAAGTIDRYCLDPEVLC
ncbi:MAG TPA: DNA internalization-related competence protein ComEC/Rec2 [Methylomirabilota bacterium]